VYFIQFLTQTNSESNSHDYLILYTELIQTKFNMSTICLIFLTHFSATYSWYIIRIFIHWFLQSNILIAYCFWTNPGLS